MRESCDVPNHSAHSDYWTLFDCQSQALLYPFSHRNTFLRLEPPSTYFLTNPWPPYVFGPILPSSLMIKWASLSPMENPPTSFYFFLYPFLRDDDHGIINPLQASSLAPYPLLQISTGFFHFHFGDVKILPNLQGGLIYWCIYPNILIDLIFS